MAQKELVDLLRRIGEKRASIADWAKVRGEKSRLDLSKADLADLDLTDINLSRADLSGSRLFNSNLSGADLSGASLTYADLRRVNLTNAFLTGANLSAANMQGANLVDTNLEHALLQGAKLSGSYLVGANLIGADLTGADLRGANCKFARFPTAIIQNVDVEDADLTQVEMDQEQRKGLLNADSAIVHGAERSPGGAGKRKMAVSETYDDLFPEADCYSILGIEPGASTEEITSAYRKRVKEYHPDRVAHLGVKLQEVARREFDRVQKAYESLSRGLAKSYVDIGEGGSVRAEDADAMRSPESLSLEDYQTLSARYPYNDRILYNLGVKYFESGWLQLAIETFEKSVALNPNNPDAQHNLKVARLLQQLIA